MKKLLISALALSVGVVLAPAGLAAAQSDEPAEPAIESTDDPTVEGRGWLAAMGSGDVEIDMGGHLRMWVEGDVILTDRAGDMNFVVHGSEEREAQNAEAGLDVILNDFRGVLRVRGSNFSITVDGEVFFLAHGRGEATLQGNGLYKTRYGNIRPWDGLVKIGGTAVEPAGAAAT
jgi:hypothetical protein